MKKITKKFQAKRQILLNVVFAIVFIFGLKSQIFAQNQRCNATDMQQQYWAQHPERAAERAAMQAGRIQLDAASPSNVKELHSPNAVLTIPVVFHICHSGEAVGTGRNISLAKIQQQLQVLNQDFSKTNTDVGQIPTQFQGIAANTEIQFCLAAIDPNGAPTTGVTRHLYSNIPTTNYIENTIKPATSWNALRYLNIWVVEMPQAAGGGGFVLGYAYLPEPTMVGSNIDGFAVDYRYVGADAPNRILGRTATHEIGHYLGLMHPWGMDEGDCQGTAGAEDDGIADTPFSSAPNYTPASGVCNSTPTQCSHVIFGDNFMDYPDDPCMHAFSAGQKTVMRAVVTGTASAYGFGSRAQLVNNAATTCNLNPVSSCSNPYNAAFNMGFETTENTASWTAENTNGDVNTSNAPVTWSIGNGVQTDGDYGPRTGSQYANYYYNNNTTSAANDWLFSSCLTLQTGKTYNLKFWYAVGKTSTSVPVAVYPEKLRVKIGTAANSTAMTTLINDLGTLNNAYPSYQQASYDFTVPANGNYYLGFQCYSIANQYILMLDDVNITGRITPTENYSNLANSVKIFPNPSSNEFEVQLTEGFDTKDAYITVYDVTGREQIRKAWAQGFETTFINANQLVPGAYFVTLHLNNQAHFTQKMMIIR